MCESPFLRDMPPPKQDRDKRYFAIKVKDPASGRTYYYHREHRVPQWHRPQA